MMRAFLADSLHRRFIFGISLLLLPVLALAVSGYILHRIAAVPANATMQELTDEIVPIQRLQTLLLKAEMPVHDHFITGNGSRLQDAFQALATKIEDAFDRLLGAQVLTAAELEKLRAARAHWRQAKSIAADLLNKSGETEGMRRFDTAIEAALNHLDEILALNHQELLANQSEIVANEQRFIFAAIVTLLVAILLVVGVSLVLARSVLVPVDRLSRGVRDLANGGLDLDVEVHGNDELGRLTAAFNAMAAKLQENRKLLEKLATHDSLTGLLRHGEFLRLLKTEMARSRRYGHPFSLLMLDVDHFKQVNDNYGHQAGDTVLKTVAGILGKSARPADIAARYGGEEFVLILPETDAEAAVAMAERLRETMGRYPIVIARDKHLKVTVSIGVAAFPADADSEKQLIAAADQALYAAKNAGRNRVCRYADIAGAKTRRRKSHATPAPRP